MSNPQPQRDRDSYERTSLVGRRLSSVYSKLFATTFNRIGRQTDKIPKHNPGSSEAVKAGAPLISKDFLPVLQQQLVHVMNKCVADPPGVIPYAAGRKVNFRNSGVELQAWTSLRGTSRVEVWHSVCAKSFACLSGISQRTYDARIGWLLLRYNRRRQSQHGLKVPPEALPPRTVYLQGQGSHLYPDWRLAVNDDHLPKIGFRYAYHVAGPDSYK